MIRDIFIFSQIIHALVSSLASHHMVRRAEETPGAVAAARAAEAALLHAARVGTAEDVRACASRVAGSSLADIDAPGSHGVTPLHAAATRGDVDVARALLSAGAAACHSHARPLRADAESGWTATHRAMYHGKWRVVQALLERGGSLDHPPDLAGRTPLDVLASRLRRSRERRATLKRDALRAKQTTRRGRVTHTNDNDRTRSVYSWGSGVNYALGHGGRDDVATPRRVDFTDVVLENADEEKNDTTGGFRDDAISVSCSKFHSVVAFRDGSVFAWGHGRGGRLGVMDAGVHDGDVAALRPTEVFFPEPPGTSFGSVSFKKDSSFLPSRTHFVTRVAAGKHHTLATTFGGALFSWGRAADGRLGYDVRDCDVQDDAGGAYQRTPRLVLGALRDAFVVDVAAANRHSAATTRAGEVFAFGSNAYGQLGRRPKTAFSFGSPLSGEPSRGSPSASPKQRDAHAFLGGSSPSDVADVAHPARDCESREWSPAAADALKPLGRVFVGVSASKRHTVVLDATGAVYQFGQGDYSPRRVALKEDERSSSSAAAAAAAAEVAAGANISLARARDGSVWGWFSKDPHLRAFRVAGFGAGDDTDAVSVAACKTACAVVTGAGDAYLFDAPEYPGGEKQNESTWFRAPAFFFSARGGRAARGLHTARRVARAGDAGADSSVDGKRVEAKSRRKGARRAGEDDARRPKPKSVSDVFGLCVFVRRGPSGRRRSLGRRRIV
jgi:alpha-tubulin suppressor-like RCC1 family protein